MPKKKRVIKVAVPCVGKEEYRAVKAVLKSGYYVSGPRVKEFEANFAKYIGTRYAVAVNSGTAAIHLALAALGIGTGDEVIVPALTFFSTATAVIHNNAIPIFADIDPEIYCLDHRDLESKITDRTKAIIPVHLYGHPAEMNKIATIADKYSIPLIEDCAQAHGAMYRSRKVGSIGRAGCWSFFATKNMTTIEGGMITTNDGMLADLARRMRSHGMTGRNTHSYLGYNYRMNEVSGAVGIEQLKKLDKMNAARNVFSRFILNAIKDIPWLKIPKIRSYVTHAWFWCPVQVDEEKLGMTTDELRKKLLEQGVETRHRYNEPLYKQPMLKNRAAYPRGCPFTCSLQRRIHYDEIFLPNVEKIAGKMIGLPNHPKLTSSEIRRIIKILHEI